MFEHARRIPPRGLRNQRIFLARCETEYEIVWMWNRMSTSEEILERRRERALVRERLRTTFSEFRIFMVLLYFSARTGQVKCCDRFEMVVIDWAARSRNSLRGEPFFFFFFFVLCDTSFVFEWTEGFFIPSTSYESAILLCFNVIEIFSSTRAHFFFFSFGWNELWFPDEKTLAKFPPNILFIIIRPSMVTARVYCKSMNLMWRISPASF